MVTRVCLRLPKHLQCGPVPATSHRREAGLPGCSGQNKARHDVPIWPRDRLTLSPQGDSSYSVWSGCHRLCQAFHVRSSLRHSGCAREEEKLWW